MQKINKKHCDLWVKENHKLCYRIEFSPQTTYLKTIHNL